MIPSPSLETPNSRPGLLARIKLSTGLAAVMLCGITLAFYYRLWLPGLVLIHRDAFNFFLPIKQHLVDRLSAGELPQWFPYEALGRPFIGATHTGVFHPFTTLYFLFSVPDAYRVSTLLSCMLGALGAFALGRRLTFSPTGALVAGIAFMLSGYVVSLADNIQYIYGLCALPIFCLALEKALVGSRTWTVAPAGVWASVFLIGDVQTGYYYGFIALLWAAARSPASHRETLLRLTLVGGLSVLLAGVQLGPAAAVFAGSNRTQAALFHVDAVYWSTHPLRLVTVLASPVGQNADPVEIGRLFFGTPQRGGMGGVFAQSLYLGVPVIGLALLGAWHRRDLRFLALLGSLGLLLALGRFGGLYDVFYDWVPLWSAFRYPEKIMGVVSFVVAMLAGAGIDSLRAGKSFPTYWLATAFFCATVGVGFSTETVSAWTTSRFGAHEALAWEVTRSAASAFLFSAIAALGLWLVIVGSRKGVLRAHFFLTFVIAIVVLDLWRANWDVYRTGPAEAATFIPPFAEAIAKREGSLSPGRFRIVSISSGQYQIPHNLDRLLGRDAQAVARRQAIRVLHNTQLQLETPQTYLAGYSRALAETLSHGPWLERAARLNVTYFIGRTFHLEDPRLAREAIAVLSDYDLALFQNPVPAKPRVYMSQQPERTATPVDPAVLFTRPDFLNGKVDVIETPNGALPGPASEGIARIERYASEEVRVQVDTPRPAVLILLDTYDKGWRATLENGNELRILRANAVVRAVTVPAGAHIVTFRYETPLLRAGALTSLAGCLMCLALIVHPRWQIRKAKNTP